MKVVSISSVYPNPAEPGLGLFVRSRLIHLAKLAEITVVAPVAVIDYSQPQQQWFKNLSLVRRRMDGAISVLHPRWLFLPGGTPLNVLCLFLRLILTLASLRARFRFDLIDAHFGYPEGSAAVLLGVFFRCPVVMTLRGSEPIFARYGYRRMCLRWALRRADAIITVSEELRAFAVNNGADPGRVRTIPNGIDASMFHPRNRADCQSRFGMRAGCPAIVCAAELIEAKGHHLAIEAVRHLREEGLDVELYIAGGVARGGASFQTELVRRIDAGNLGAAVHLLGWVDREAMAELMTAADVFCLASFTEGWPNVVNEAIACGTPVVATRVGAIPAMLPDRKYGIVVPPRDQHALTEALRDAILAEWDRDAIAKWGRMRSWDDTAHEIARFIEQLAWRSAKDAGADDNLGSAAGKQCSEAGE
jgi:glycosyltransferase involved in cell wall biosynthesis